ncbi:MAG: glutamate-5-semialdehyde dehydrogenase [Acinetobacter sp.]|nr:glutamate-5-semialdehyde dehydrogenase [Acinetobacter sp.]
MTQDLAQYMTQLGQTARIASRQLSIATTQQKNHALECIFHALQQQQEAILNANQQDIHHAQHKGLDAASIDRLTLTPARFQAMLTGLQDVIRLADPIGEITDMNYRPSGIQLGKMRVPLGVIGMIYESRPNVTLEAAALALKSGNAIILRGGSEAIHSNQAIAQAIQTGLAQSQLSPQSVQVVAHTDRDAVGYLIRMSDDVDVIIPRGGKSLVARISEEARIPVIKHLDGICHVYVDDEACLDKAVSVALNAKTHRYGVCNAMETLLIHQRIAAQFLAHIVPLYQEKGVELRVCAESATIFEQQQLGAYQRANEQDWHTEYLAPILAIKLVDDMEHAIMHINHYGSHHTDAIMTENYSKARLFLAQVDSSSVMINASTRFADGFEYGLGAEIGISTDKIHARGPVGLHGLTSQKWIVFGDGHIRQ